jgi:hypothetical protein
MVVLCAFPAGQWLDEPLPSSKAKKSSKNDKPDSPPAPAPPPTLAQQREDVVTSRSDDDAADRALAALHARFNNTPRP